jgi:hypothetical protein
MSDNGFCTCGGFPHRQHPSHIPTCFTCGKTMAGPVQYPEAQGGSKRREHRPKPAHPCAGPGCKNIIPDMTGTMGPMVLRCVDCRRALKGERQKQYDARRKKAITPAPETQDTSPALRGAPHEVAV